MRVEPALAAVAAVQAAHPDLDVEQFGGASANKAVNETITDDLKKAGELSLPITLIILTHHVRHAGGGRYAAAASGSPR